ncbi:hypothetical protein ABZ619_24735 [Streptomyces sp. NPDC007851]|uniref:hypothetical protein n=1 Tax=Streptomyces sp. NPDC007851 TaxID=3155008 RepID=UPI0033EB6E97
MTLGLLASAAILFYIGANDTFGALTYGWRVTGILFVAAALIDLFGVLAAFDYWGKRVVRYSGAVLLVGVGIVVVTDSILLALQLRGGEFTALLLLWCGLALWAAWALWVLVHQKVWQGVPHPKNVALGVLTSGVVGVASLVYSQVYLPSSAPTHTIFKVSMGVPTMNEDGASLDVPVHFEFRNSASMRMYVVGSMWKLVGDAIKFSPAAAGVDVWKQEYLFGGGFYRHSLSSPVYIFGAGRGIAPGAWLDPGDDFSVDSLVNVPLKVGLTHIRAIGELSFIRGDKFTLGDRQIAVSWNPYSKNKEHLRDAPKWVANPGDEWVRNYSRVYRSSEMLNMTMPASYVSAWSILPRWHQGLAFAKGDTDPDLVITTSRGVRLAKSSHDSSVPDVVENLNTTRETDTQTVAHLLEMAKR